jgi:hypothetical protein
MATARNPFENLRFTGKDQEASVNWYRERIKDLGTAPFKPTNLMSNDDLLVNRIVPGQLYLYYYDPKTKETLPYYDTFPLVYPYKRIQGGFMGYNLHYLPPVLRFKVMGTLLNIQTYGTREEKKILYSYGVLNANEVDKYYSPCIRRYLTSQVRSRFLRIPAQDWLSAAVLPTERFAKASAAKIWKESLDKIK